MNAASRLYYISNPTEQCCLTDWNWCAYWQLHRLTAMMGSSAVQSAVTALKHTVIHAHTKHSVGSQKHLYSTLSIVHATLCNNHGHMTPSWEPAGGVMTLWKTSSCTYTTCCMRYVMYTTCCMRCTMYTTCCMRYAAPCVRLI